MSRIRGKDTKPELRVRSQLHRMGYRFRLHRKDLPGRPDIVLPKYDTVIFVHGCFWHRHKGCRFAYTPKTRVEFWETKFEQNVRRDRRNEAALRKRGWRIIRIWECETESFEALARLIRSRMKV
jgi:DNA mismatch endonuclease, patch repair protein